MSLMKILNKRGTRINPCFTLTHRNCSLNLRFESSSSLLNTGVTSANLITASLEESTENFS